MSTKQALAALTRREALLLAAGASIVAAGGVVLTSGAANADQKLVDEAMMRLIGDKKPTDGKITLELPQIAENGNTVPMGIKVDSPMTADNYVKAVHVFADKNPAADVATFKFSTMSGKAEASTRIRLAGTQNIIAVAEMSDGSVYSTKQEIKVTIGGCGG